jgi:hypothetical protein
MALLAPAFAQPVYVVLWFDTEDYITPQDDDACLRLAKDLTARGVRATFKMVAEKARVLEQRGRRDVIEALKKHDIAYHSENHSIPPTPAVYLRGLSMTEGAEEFYRREGPGARDVMRIFGVQSLSTYGQPGSSWGPQSHAALLRMGIRTYVDEGRHAGIDHQPFWWSGLLWIFNLGPYAQRMSLEPGASVEEQARKFAAAAATLQSQGGGVMHFWYHPNEFVTTEFWDGVNFSLGANPPRSDWKPAKLRTPEDAERCYRVLNEYVDRIKKIPGVQFKSVAEVYPLFAPQEPPPLDPEWAKDLLRTAITWHGSWSAAEILAAAVGVPGKAVGAPRDSGGASSGEAIKRADFDRAKKEVAGYIREVGRLPSRVWSSNRVLSIGDFAAMLARDDGQRPFVEYRQATLAFEKHIGTDGTGNFNWVIHPFGFDGSRLYDLARVEAWTLKPARLATAGDQRTR